jgi:hypothetical protein
LVVECLRCEKIILCSASVFRNKRRTSGKVTWKNDCCKWKKQ